MLNKDIATSRLLGEQYEIGHTYFFDIVGFLERWDDLRLRGQRPKGYLWSAAGQPKAPLLDLWEHRFAHYCTSISPASTPKPVKRS